MRGPKRDRYAISVRLTQEEDAWVRAECAALNIDLSEGMRIAAFHGFPLMRGNSNCLRVRFEDVRRDTKSM